MWTNRPFAFGPGHISMVTMLMWPERAAAGYFAAFYRVLRGGFGVMRVFVVIVIR
jgi:hypothetical protein